jgi:hypothetical protein
MTQAESIVAQAKSIGFEESVQGGLFGDEVVADNAFLSRARILDSTLKYLRGQKSVFKTLVDDASVIEQYGNSLNKLTNAQKDRIYGEAIEKINKMQTMLETSQTTSQPSQKNLKRQAQKTSVNTQSDLLPALSRELSQAISRGLRLAEEGAIIGMQRKELQMSQWERNIATQT